MFDLSEVALREIIAQWGAAQPYSRRVDRLRLTLNSGSVIDDSAADQLFGGSGRDWFFQGVGDDLADCRGNEELN